MTKVPTKEKMIFIVEDVHILKANSGSEVPFLFQSLIPVTQLSLLSPTPSHN